METDTRKINEELLAFLDASPNAFFAVDNMKKMLVQAGFTELKEQERWEIRPSGAYFVTRNNSALIAFRMPGTERFDGL